LETLLKTLNELELQGGHNYWMRFKKAEQGIGIEMLILKSRLDFQPLVKSVWFPKRRFISLAGLNHADAG